jgi:hypothetical protein
MRDDNGKPVVEKLLEHFPTEKKRTVHVPPKEVIQNTDSSVTLAPMDDPFWKKFLKGRHHD